MFWKRKSRGRGVVGPPRIHGWSAGDLALIARELVNVHILTADRTVVWEPPTFAEGEARLTSEIEIEGVVEGYGGERLRATVSELSGFPNGYVVDTYFPLERVSRDAAGYMLLNSTNPDLSLDGSSRGILEVKLRPEVLAAIFEMLAKSSGTSQPSVRLFPMDASALSFERYEQAIGLKWTPLYVPVWKVVTWEQHSFAPHSRNSL